MPSAGHFDWRGSHRTMLATETCTSFTLFSPKISCTHSGNFNGYDLSSIYLLCWPIGIFKGWFGRISYHTLQEEWRVNKRGATVLSLHRVVPPLITHSIIKWCTKQISCTAVYSNIVYITHSMIYCLKFRSFLSTVK